MGILEFCVIVFATVMAWPLISRLTAGLCAILIGVFVPAGKVHVTYQDDDGNKHEADFTVKNFEKFVAELKKDKAKSDKSRH